jgi:hypothetical protein
VWRPDGKGRHGLEEDYEYVMYGKVSLFIRLAGQGPMPCRCINSTKGLTKMCKFDIFYLDLVLNPLFQNRLRVLWRTPLVSDGILPTFDQHSSR